jgi:hypothetical protein
VGRNGERYEKNTGNGEKQGVYCGKNRGYTVEKTGGILWSNFTGFSFPLVEHHK